MAKNVMRKFNVPLKEHDWVQKWCVDVHNIASSRKLDWKSLLDCAVGHTQNISTFRFHMWERHLFSILIKRTAKQDRPRVITVVITAKIRK